MAELLLAAELASGRGDPRTQLDAPAQMIGRALEIVPSIVYPAQVDQRIAGDRQAPALVSRRQLQRLLAACRCLMELTGQHVRVS